MEEKYLNKIYYRKNKIKKRATLVFIHGFPGSSSVWIPYEKRFDEKYNIISIDLRGHGKSFRPDNPSEYSIENSSLDLYNILKHEKIKKVHLIAHSFGCFVAFDFLKNHQKKVESAILIGGDYAPSKRKIIKLLIPVIYLTKITNKLPSMKSKGHVDYSKFINTSDWNLKRMLTDIKNTGIKSYLNNLKNIYYYNIENMLQKIEVPILIVHGNNDKIIPVKISHRMKERTKFAQLKIIKKAGHIIPMNNIKELSKIMETFLK